jgi:dolichol-phosphate mannosyltransferase
MSNVNSAGLNLSSKSETPELSVVMPAYQEEENLRLLLPRVLETLDGIGQSFEVLIVDTQVAMDGTPELCEEYGVAYSPRERGNMYGDAIRHGLGKSRGKYVILMDSDGSHPPEWIARLYSDRAGHDVVIASRYVDGGATENGWVLVLMSRVLNWTYSFALGIKCSDISNSYRLYRGEQVRALSLKCNNFDIVEEILYKICRFNPEIQLKEIPVTFKQRLFGRTKRKLVVFVAGYLFTLIKLRFFI